MNERDRGILYTTDHNGTIQLWLATIDCLQRRPPFERRDLESVNLSILYTYCIIAAMSVADAKRI